MTNYQEGNEPYGAMAGGQPPQQGVPTPGEQYADPTTRMQPQGQPWEQQGRYEAGPYRGPGYREEHHRPHLQVRSPFLTTEFWVFLVVALGTLIAAAFTDDPGPGLGFGAHDAWKFVTWLAIGYMLSRGLTKLGGNRRDGGEHGRRL